MAETLISPGIAMTEIDQSAIPPRPLVAGAAILGPTVKGRVMIPTKVTSYAEYQRIFGTTFKTTTGSIETTQEFLTSIAAKNYFEQGGDSLLVTRIANTSAFFPATSSLILSSGSVVTSSFELVTLSPGAYNNNLSSASAAGEVGPIWQAATTAKTADEYLDGSAISGSTENIRWEIVNVNEDKGTFGLNIRRGDDSQLNPIILESYPVLSLDPESPNYIARQIGDSVETVVSDGTETYVNVVGNYPNISKYVRVNVLRTTPNYLDNEGNPRPEYTGSLPMVQRGGFYNAAGVVGTCYDSTGSVDASGKALYFEQIVATEGTTDYNQSVKAADYEKAIDLLNNTDEYQINIISAPGLLDSGMVGKLISMAQNRGDCIAVVDLVSFNEKSASAVANLANAQNNSYAATYWPWLQMISATGKYVWVPASTVIPGVYTYTDHQAAPWYAPAGMTRGGVQGVVQTAKKLTKGDRDILYEKNVNPIATMPGAGIVVYGQKTLQKKASALDRVNVRRLLIEVKDKIRTMAAGLLFEQNTQALQNQFRSQVDPYLASIVQRKGLVGYSIDLSENDDPNVVDRNEFRAAITLQPTKTVEFVYLTFTVTATGVSFD